MSQRAQECIIHCYEQPLFSCELTQGLTTKILLYALLQDKSAQPLSFDPPFSTCCYWGLLRRNTNRDDFLVLRRAPDLNLHVSGHVDVPVRGRLVLSPDPASRVSTPELPAKSDCTFQEDRELDPQSSADSFRAMLIDDYGSQITPFRNTFSVMRNTPGLEAAVQLLFHTMTDTRAVSSTSYTAPSKLDLDPDLPLPVLLSAAYHSTRWKCPWRNPTTRYRAHSSLALSE